jgi:glycosyltransferase involved in cell wall biosynthesis
VVSGRAGDTGFRCIARYTPPMVPLSAVLITRNEEDMLADAIESVRFCDEIVVVDSGSSDGTQALARAMGARLIVSAPWPGFVAQRNVAVDAAANDWVLALDADERITPTLREEIQAERARGFACAGYRIPRVAFYLGRWIKATDWWPDPQVRLFDRRRARWEGQLVHESVRVRGPLGRLRSEMAHYPYRDVSDHLGKIDRYTTLWARQMHAAGRRARTIDLLFAPNWAFVRNFVLKGGFLLGRAGLTVSALNAYYTYTKLAKLDELGNGRPPLAAPPRETRPPAGG